MHAGGRTGRHRSAEAAWKRINGTVQRLDIIFGGNGDGAVRGDRWLYAQNPYLRMNARAAHYEITLEASPLSAIPSKSLPRVHLVYTASDVAPRADSQPKHSEIQRPIAYLWRCRGRPRPWGYHGSRRSGAGRETVCPLSCRGRATYLAGVDLGDGHGGG